MGSMTAVWEKLGLREALSAARGLVRLVVLGVGALTLSGCGLLDTFKDGTYRFRMTVEVETPEGVKSGSSVYQVSVAERLQVTPESLVRKVTLTGESVAVDIAPGRTLFTLLKTISFNDSFFLMSLRSLQPNCRRTYGSPEECTIDAMVSRLSKAGPGKPFIVKPDSYPMLVTFSDLDDPTSVERVDPDDLAASFGEGVTLKRITVQLTDDSVTTAIEERLKWLVDPAVMGNPGWRSMPLDVRKILLALRSSKVGTE
jgi:hypothetical protein